MPGQIKTIVIVRDLHVLIDGTFFMWLGG